MESNIALFALLACVSIAGKGAPAQKSLDAYLKYTGADQNINQSMKNVQNEVPKETQIYLGASAYIGQTLLDKKLVLVWHF